MRPRGIISDISALDDSSLLEILTRVGAADACDLANCRCVSKRWREVAWVVPRLAFRFGVRTDELRDKEFIISNVLRSTRRAAPGCLKALKVTLIPMLISAELFEVTGHWLVYAADSVVDLELELLVYCEADEEPQWGPAVWSSLSGFRALKRLKIDGCFCCRDLLPLRNESPFITLTSCHLEESAATSELLQVLCASCPVLKDLSVVDCLDLNSIQIATPSLERFVLRPDCCTRWGAVVALRVHLCTPRLESLYIQTCSREGVDLSMASAESLSKLRLHGSCVIRGDKQYERVTHLHVEGHWKIDALVSLFQRTPMLTNLTMHSSLRVNAKIPIGKVFASLAYLKMIDCHSLEVLEADDTGLLLERVTVHVRVLQGSILKQLLDVYCVQRVVAHDCQWMLGLVSGHVDGRIIIQN